jgi:hypothetical protein
MNCDICKKLDPHLIVILPIHQPNGNLDTLACEECALKSKAYCKKHERPHLGFFDGTTACAWCIEEMVKEKTDQAEEIRNCLRALLPEDQLEALNDAAEMSAEVAQCTESVAVLRFLASKAKRTNETVDDVVYQITESGHSSVDYILWR